MSVRIGKKTQENKKIIIGELRRTQVITTFGPGAIIDMPDVSAIMAGTDFWKKEKYRSLYDINLCRLLGVSHFKEPYVKPSDDYASEKITADTPAFRFPNTYFCPKCGKIDFYKNFKGKKSKSCYNCGSKAVPSRFVVACINGHLEDFPYNWWVHRGYIENAVKHKLKIKFSSESGGLEGIVIECETCGAKRSMKGALSREALKGHKCQGHRPWLGKTNDKNDPIECNAVQRALQRGASNTYFPLTSSALTIPPWSRRLYQDVNKYRSEIDKWSATVDPKIAIEKIMSKEINERLYTLEEILKAYENGIEVTRKAYTKQNLLEDEYTAFLHGNDDAEDDLQFRVSKTSVDTYFDGLIDDILAVKRLREIIALRGFRRIKPEGPDAELAAEEQKDFEGYNLEDCVSLSQERLDWLPAVELLGEGIFIRLNEKRLRCWEKENDSYYKDMKTRLSKSIIKCDNFSPRYVLLHTLAHLLIRQLTMECGYSGASIKERIYSTYPDSDVTMAGILLYTAAADSDGSLGGLVRNAYPEHITGIFKRMLQEASWCSSDPICMDSKGQGYDSLNYAACHACALLPETSCEMRNCLLDRTAVVSMIGEKRKGYFNK